MKSMIYATTCVNLESTVTKACMLNDSTYIKYPK